MRLLLVAPTCDGTDVGEAWVAHQWVKRLSKRHDVTLLTYRKRGRPSASDQLQEAEVVEWLEMPLVGRAERLNSMLKPSYIPFYLQARRWIRHSLAAGRTFDVAHQLTPVAMRYPSPLSGQGLPWIMGPVGGGLPDLPAFAEHADSAPAYVRLRGTDAWRLRHDPMLRATYESADCVAVIAPYVQESLRGLSVRRVEVMSETALESLPVLPDRDRSHDRPLRLLFVGRVIRTKGVRDLVRALSLVGDLETSLDVIGDGFDRAACEVLTEDLGITDRVTFHGKLPRSQIDSFYAGADVFVFPSYREPGGNVVLEAMGYGLPLIVCDRGGPGAATDDHCAIRIVPVNPDQLAKDVAAAIRTLAHDPQLRRTMGAAARRRVAETALWERRIEQAEALYASIA